LFEPLQIIQQCCSRASRRHHLALARFYSTGVVAALGDSNEKHNRECGALSSADVFGSDGPGTRRRRGVGRRVGCRGARTDRCRSRCCHRLHGGPVDFAFMGPAPLERAAPGAESREPGSARPCRRQPTCAHSVCTQRSSSSASGCPSAAVHDHHHGFHRAAGPVARVST
jgi:hypothetical protein